VSRIYNTNHKMKGLFQDSNWNDSHLFVVKHRFFEKLGLSTFSLNEIYDWVCETKTGVDRVPMSKMFSLDPNAVMSKYENVKLYQNALNTLYPGLDSPVDAIIGSQNLTKDLYINAWRSSGRNGRYEEIEIQNWSLQIKEESYTYSDLQLDEFAKKNVDGGDLEPSSYSDNAYSLQWSIIDKIIQVNNFVNILHRTKKVEDFTRKERARYEFVTDIRASKQGCILWKSRLGFVLQLPVKTHRGIPREVSDSCLKNDEIEFRLHLYGGSNPKNTERVAAIQNPVYAQLRQNPIGQTYVNEDEKGSQVEYNVSNPKPSNAVSAPMSMTYSELEGRWESGTQQIFAILQSDIAAAEYPVDFLLSDENTLLDPSNGFGIKTGSAMPILMKNRNPKQWMPNFKLTREQRERATEEAIKNEKVFIDVYNPFNVGFASGDPVILQKIQGVWIPLTPGAGAATPVAPADPNWDFTYLMTNTMHYFKTKDRKVTIDPLTYEKAFYNEFYKGDEIPVENSATIKPITNSAKSNKERYSASFPVIDIDGQQKSSKQYIETTNGYMQITSWDYMGRHFGGTKTNNENSLSAIRFGFDADNQPFEDDGYDKKMNTYPFFGCVFPDGHVGGTTLAQVQNENRDFCLYANNMCINNTTSSNGVLTEITYGFFNNVGRSESPFTPFSDDISVRGNYDLLNSAQKKGMFHEEQGNFWNLPADIATNCSTQGQWGWPISSVGHWQEKIRLATSQDNFRSNIYRYFDEREDGRPIRYNWVSKRKMSEDKEIVSGVFSDEKVSFFSSSGTGGDSYSYHDNVFNIKPNNALKIEFRPLSQELYSQWEFYTADFPNSWEGAGSVSLVSDNKELALESDNRGEYAYRIYQATSYNLYEPFLSKESLLRNWYTTDTGLDSEYSLIGKQGEGENLNKIFHNGLKYNVDISPYENNGIPDTVNNPRNWWDENWHDPKLDGGAGAIGVIGAVVTVSTNDIIDITTENALGVDGYLEFFSPIEGNQFGCSLRNGDYKDAATTNLYARIYTQHPRELTVYDPRFFVVHHFNDDIVIERQDVTMNWASGGAVYTNEEILADNDVGGLFYNNDPVNGTFVDQDAYSYSDKWYKVSRRDSDLDLRVPTYATVNGLDEIPAGTDVFGDAITTGSHKIRSNSEDWKLTTQRRGKLLPYSFNYNVLAVAPSGSDDITQMVEEGYGPEAVKDINKKIMITASGAGYSNSDLFSVAGGKGGFLLRAITSGDHGGITGFKVEAPGLRFNIEDFLPSEQIIQWEVGDDAPTGGLEIIPYPQSVNPTQGTGLKAFTIAGQVILSPILTDFKPKLATGSREIKVTPNIPRCDDNNLTPQEQDALTTNIDIIDFSANNQYDIFLHYHNDISHTRIDAGDIPFPAEQMVRLNIGTNDGSTTSTNSANSTLNLNGNDFSSFDADSFSMNSNLDTGLGGAFFDNSNNQGNTLGGGGLGGGSSFR